MNNSNNTAQIKKAIDAIVKLAIAPYPTPAMEKAQADAMEYLNTLNPESARAAMKLADVLIENHFTEDED